MATTTMTRIDAVLAALEAAGTEQNRKVYRRHGAREPLFGVSFAELRKLQKAIKRDHDLAVALWSTGNTDARTLACFVADPAAMTEAELDVWLAEIDYYTLVDVFVGNVASKVSGVRERALRWIESERDWTAQAGWDLVGHLASDPHTDDELLAGLLARIEREIERAGNRTRHAMNGALIAIGIRSEAFTDAAVAAAERIGSVIVDHGETGCVTPAAIPYIHKTLAYRDAQARKRAATEASRAESKVETKADSRVRA